MSKNNNKGYVRPITTGHIEADMLGQVYMYLAERQNRKYAQRPHRTYKKRQTKSIFRVAVECIQTAPTACLRSLNVLISKGKELYIRVANHLRKHFRNGK